MQPLTNQDLPAMAAVLCNRQTIFRRTPPNYFSKTWHRITRGFDSFDGCTNSPPQMTLGPMIYIFILKFFTTKMVYLDKSKLTTWKVDKKRWKRSLAWERRSNQRLRTFHTLIYNLIPFPYSMPLFNSFIPYPYSMLKVETGKLGDGGNAP